MVNFLAYVVFDSQHFPWEKVPGDAHIIHDSWTRKSILVGKEVKLQLHKKKTVDMYYEIKHLQEIKLLSTFRNQDKSQKHQN